MYVRDVVHGVAHLHELGIAHRDLKCANLLLADDEHGGVKIADFGTATRVMEELGGVITEREDQVQPMETARFVVLVICRDAFVEMVALAVLLTIACRTWHLTFRSVREGLGSPFWMAPELVRAEKGADSWRKADIWGIGCVVIEMATGRPPWVRETRSCSQKQRVSAM